MPGWPEVLLLVGSDQCGVNAAVEALTEGESGYTVCRERPLGGGATTAPSPSEHHPPLAITRYAEAADYLYARRDDADGTVRGVRIDALVAGAAGDRIPVLPLPDLSITRLVSRVIRARGRRPLSVYVYGPESLRPNPPRVSPRAVDAERRAKVEAINTLFRGADAFVVASRGGGFGRRLRDLIEQIRARPDEAGRIGRPRGLDAAELELIEKDLRELQRWLRASGRHPRPALGVGSGSAASSGSAA